MEQHGRNLPPRTLPQPPSLHIQDNLQKEAMLSKTMEIQTDECDPVEAEIGIKSAECKRKVKIGVGKTNDVKATENEATENIKKADMRTTIYEAAVNKRKTGDWKVEAYDMEAKDHEAAAKEAEEAEVKMTYEMEGSEHKAASSELEAANWGGACK
jgi:hypothetical protein